MPGSTAVTRASKKGHTFCFAHRNVIASLNLAGPMLARLEGMSSLSESVCSIAAASAAALLLLAAPAFAQGTYPDRPVYLINSGGAANGISRLLGDKLSSALGQPFVTELVPGAGGVLAATRVARSAADGHTLFVAGEASVSTNVALADKLPYDPLIDFAPITLAVDSVNLLALHPSLPVNSVQELVTLAKSKPGFLTVAHPGIGTSPHIAGKLLQSMAGIDILLVPYREANAIIPDLLVGRIHMYFGNISALLPLVQEGKLRAIAVTSAKRVALLPNLPTMAESGFPGYQATTWVGFLAPAKTPETVIQTLHQEVTRALSLPDMRQRLSDMGLIIVGTSSAAFAAQLAEEIPRKKKMFQDAGIKRE
jgi:tripartite-type tricarboxylate transporter receptor subunit TctC